MSTSSTLPPDVALARLRRRRPDVTQVPPSIGHGIERWLEEGRRLALVGPDGSGRTHLLDHIARALESDGRTWIRLQSLLPVPWSAADGALQDPSLPGPAAELPRHDTPQRCAQAAAAILHRRAQGALWVLVDDLERIDEASAVVVKALSRRPGVHIAVAAERAPEWAERACVLPRWTAGATTVLAESLLEHGVAEAAGEALSEASQGRPGRIVELLEAAVEHGWLDPATGAWTAEAPALSEWPDPSPSRTQRGLPPATCEVGKALALAGRALSPNALARLTGVPEPAVGAALEALTARALVRVERGRASCRDAGAVALLTPNDSAALHRTLALQLLESGAHQAALVPHLLGAAQPELVARAGAAALGACARRAPSAAAAQAGPLWALGQTDDLAAAGVRALCKAGRPGEALGLGERALEASSGDADPLARAELLAALAALHHRHLGDTVAARTALREARRALVGAAPPLHLLAAEADLHLEARHHAQALAVARQGTTRPLPQAQPHRDAWYQLRILEARALAAGDRVQAATTRLRDLPADTTPLEREAMAAESATLLWGAGQFLAAAEAWCEAAGLDPDTEGAEQIRWLDRPATARYHGGDRSGAVETWGQALALAQRAHDDDSQARIEATLCSVLREICRFDEAARHGQEAFDRASAAGAIHHAVNAALGMGDLRMVTGALDEAATWLGRCGRLVERHRLPKARGRLLRRWAELAIRRADPRAKEAIAEAVHVANSTELVRDACRATALKAVLLARTDQPERLDATIRRAIEPLVKRGAARTLAEVRLWAAQARLEAGQHQKAIDEAAHALVWADEVGHLLFRNRADDLTARARALAWRTEDVGPDANDVESLLEVAVALGRERHLDTLLDKVADAAMQLVQADRAFVILVEEGSAPRVAAARSASDRPPGRPSNSVVQTVLQRGREVIVSNVKERADLRAQDSIVHLRLQSAWCIPLIEGDRTLGALYADSRVITQAEVSRATRLLRGLAGQAAVAVTNARLLEESQERAERAADIAHDIRSPLGSVVMAAEQLNLLEELPGWARETLTLMEAQVCGVMDMAHRFLEDRPSQQRPFDLAKRAERLASFAAQDARHSGRTVVFEATGPAPVHGAPEEIDRALTNLLSNALEHTPKGTTVRVRVKADADEVLLTVRDHGPGISEEQMPLLFERGQRGQSSGGFGLGLHIARRIVQDAGGELTARNADGGGAMFCLKLPARASAARQADGHG